MEIGSVHLAILMSISVIGLCIWQLDRLSRQSWGNTIGGWFIAKRMYETYQDLIKITGYVSVIVIMLFFLIYNLFPATVVVPPKNWTLLRKLVLSLSSYITLGRGDIRVKNPILQLLMTVEGFIGFIFVIFIGSRMVLAGGRPYFTPKELRTRRMLDSEASQLFRKADMDDGKEDGIINYIQFHRMMRDYESQTRGVRTQEEEEKELG